MSTDNSVVKEAMESGLTFTQFVGIVATITTVGQSLSGTFTARKVWQLRSPGDLSPVPFIAAVLGSSLWFLYGVLLKDSTVMYTNIAGITLNSFYVFVFYLYTAKKVLMSRQILSVLIIVMTIVIYIRSFSVGEEMIARNQLGLICTIVSLSSCASPLITLKHVMRTKSTETLPFPLILCIFIVCLLWYVYAVLIEDFYMQVTNLLGSLIGLAQLSLFYIYPSSSHRDKDYHSGNI